MIKLTNNFNTNQLIYNSEKSFNDRLNEVCDNIIDSKTHIIALSGPTCSGKTTTATKLTEALTKNGCEVYLISIDNFFLPREVLDKNAIMNDNSIDYDSVNAIDLKLFAQKTASIISGNPTELPIYDFSLGKSTQTYTVDPNEHSVFIFEGIQAIYPEVTSLLGDNYKSIYICVDEDVEIDDVYFGKRELRLLRRLIRDYKFRGASPEFTLFLWRSVAANEDRSIIPYADTAEIKINSFMPYEIFIMSALLPEILNLVPDSSIYYPKACEILRKLDKLAKIPPSLVPDNSLLREFIG